MAFGHWQVMWLAAAEYAQRLRGACGLEPDQVDARVRQLAQARVGAAVTPEPKARPAAQSTPGSAPKQAAAHAPRGAIGEAHPPPPRLVLRRRSHQPVAAQPAVAANEDATQQAPQLGRRLRRISQRQTGAERDTGVEGDGGADADAALADDEWPEEGDPPFCAPASTYWQRADN